MPGPDGKLTPEEFGLAAAWLAEKTKNYTCPVCDTNNWGIVGNMLQESVYSEGSLLVGGSVYPMIAVSCMNCAYTRHFNAIQMGIMKGGIVRPDPFETTIPPKKAEGANVR
ncbi:MAG TPA: hypothetical protein VHZ29_13115 [Rhizomicrobium sp.]|jgi:hypothetical protein|nr:hypothetical protein [Rhizomicrobium sp.]